MMEWFLIYSKDDLRPLQTKLSLHHHIRLHWSAVMALLDVELK